MKKIKIYLFCRDRLIEWEINESQKDTVEFFLNKKTTLFKKDYVISIKYENGFYKLESTNDFTFNYKNEDIKSKRVLDGDIFICNFHMEKSKVILFVQYENINNAIFNKWYIKGLEQIKIGKSDTNHIIYDNENVLDEHVVLTFNEDGCSIETVNNAVGCYINQVKFSKEYLKFGDVIFLYGLKCVYLEEYIAVNDPNNNTYSKLIKIKENQLDISLPRKFVNFKRDTLSRHKDYVDINQEKSIVINPPKIDLKYNFKFLYYGVIPLVIIIFISQILNLILNNNSNYKYLIYDGVFGLFFVAIVFVISSILNRLRINRNIKNYNEYLKNKTSKIDSMKEEKVKYLNKKHSNTMDCYNMVIDQDKDIWKRNITDEEFLTINIGEGEIFLDNVHVKSTVSSSLQEDHKLYQNYIKVKNEVKFINKAPIILSLKYISKLAVVSDMYNLYNVVKSFLIQLTSMHSYKDLKIAFLLSDNFSESLDYIKEIPHVYSDKKDFRYIASNKEELISVIYKIKNIISEREVLLSENKNHIFVTNYVVFVFYDSSLIIDSFLKYVEKINKELGIFVIFITIENKNIPKAFENILEIGEKIQNLYKINDTQVISYHNYDEIEYTVDMKKFVYSLSNIKNFDNLSDDISFENNNIFDLYGVSDIEDLNILNRWEKNKLLELETLPVAIKDGKEKFSININSKLHGPNGIIFGESGTGKTEFLRSLILSYCINLHPNNLNFIILKSNENYKLANFTRLPHVTNILDKDIESEKNRLILLVENEIKNRQALFSSLKVNDIESYLNVYESYIDMKIMPYLVIIIDDVEESDSKFIEELTKLYSYMSSVGIYIIVSSNDSNLFNSKNDVLSRFNFKMCFALSNVKDMFRIMEDTSISNPKTLGMFNIKFSNVEVFRDLSIVFSNFGYKIENSEENLDIVNNCGLSIKKVSRVKYNEDINTQEEIIINKISDLSKIIDLNVIPVFDSSLKYFSIQDLEGYVCNFNGFMWCDSHNECSAVVGVMDDPKYQVQRFLDVDFKNLGNLFVYGASGVGKSTLVKTLVYSLCCEYKPSCLNIYMVNINSRSMDYYSYAPHINQVAYNKEEVNDLFKKVLDEFDLRKRIFESLDISSLDNYEIKTGEHLPYIILIIDSIQDIENDTWDYINFIKLMAKKGNLYGIYVCVTSCEYTDVEIKLSGYFANKFVLKLNDEKSYKSILGKDVNINSKFKGRGYVSYKDLTGNRILEFQIGLPLNCKNDIDLNNKLKFLFKHMNDVNKDVYECNIKEVFENKDIEDIEVDYEIINEDIDLYEYENLSLSENIDLCKILDDLKYISKNIVVMHNGIGNSLKTTNKFINYFKKMERKIYLFGNLNEEISDIDYTEGIWEDYTEEKVKEFIISLNNYKNENNDNICIFIPEFNELIEYITEESLRIFNSICEDMKFEFIISYNKKLIINEHVLDSLLKNGIELVMNHEYDLNEDTFIMYKSEKNMVKID